MSRHRIVAVLSLVNAWLMIAAAGGEEPRLSKIELFRAGTDGYTLYRIPGLVVTRRGTVLAYCEARKDDRGDWGATDIMLRRSTDGGQTWQPPKQIAVVGGPKQKNPAALAQQLGRREDVTYNNPVAITDQQTGAVHFLFCLEYMRCFYMRSDDDGQTFSAPVDITTTFMQFRSQYDVRVIATGPGHGIQLDRGRLVVPVWISPGTGGHAHRPSMTSVIYSDDHGGTWNRGAVAGPNTEPFVIPNEAVAVQLADGRVMLNMRSESKAHRRLIAYSWDGATRWTPPFFHEQLLEPICMASMVRLSRTTTHKRNRLLFSNPDSLDPRNANTAAEPGQGRARKNLSVKLSYDEGESWPISQTIEPGPSGYSDLAVTPDGTILCFYERGSSDGKAGDSRPSLALARFNLEWLTDGRDALSRLD